jgi:hypothetical protein
MNAHLLPLFLELPFPALLPRLYVHKLVVHPHLPAITLL